MPLPRKITSQPATTATTAKSSTEAAYANANRWIAAGGAAEVRASWLNAKNKGQAELMAAYEKALSDAGFSVFPQ